MQSSGKHRCWSKQQGNQHPPQTQHNWSQGGLDSIPQYDAKHDFDVEKLQ